MKWSTEDRQGPLRTLDAVDGGVITLYRVFLRLIIAAVLAVVGLVIVRRPWGAGSQGGAVLLFDGRVLLVLGWVVGQFAMLNRRQRHRRSPVTFDSSTGGGGWT